MNDNKKNESGTDYSSKHKSHSRRRKISKKIVFIIVAAICAVAIFLIAFFVNKDQNDKDNNNDFESPTIQTNEPNTSDFSIQLTHFSSDVQIVDDVVLKCYNAESIEELDKQIKFSYSTGKRLDKALPVKFDFDISNIPTGVIIDKITVDISKSQDISDPRTFTVSGNERTINITHLEADTKYYYRINLFPTDYCACGSFKTADTIRVVNLAGVPNVRDIGNHTLTNGKKIKQGLFYRGGELDGIFDANSKINSTGIAVANQVFEFKTEMDLRTPTAGSDKNHSVAGLNASYKCYNASSYSDIFNESGKASMKNIFTDLANKDNYPVYVHCTYGFDRTGSVCFILEALLGLDIESIEKEYYMSRLAYPNVSTDRFDELVSGLDQYDGISTKQKAESYLLSAGITQEQIDSIREILTEK